MHDALYCGYNYFPSEKKMNHLKLSGKGLKLIEEFEGLRLNAYQDSIGLWTIGYGHTKGVRQGDYCTKTQAEEWIAQDAQTASSAVNRLVTEVISQNEFDALTAFTYNVGQRNLENSTLLKLLNSGDHAGAADQFKRFDKAGGVHVPGLLRRRNAEADLFRSAQP